jgi:low affinity Fe/Cu permease
MFKEIKKKESTFLEKFATVATKWTGSSAAFLIATGVILCWIITGPLFGFSDTWQLIINTGTTIVTFLMVFLIQRAQNKDSLGVHLKLNELIASQQGASNRLINIENLTEQELLVLQKYFGELADKSKEDNDLQMTHSIEEARELHERKKRNQN